MLVDACSFAVRGSGRTLSALCLAQFVLSVASSTERAKDVLLLFQSSWSVIDENGAYVSSYRRLGWEPHSDPCLSRWTGIECACASASASSCAEYAVIGLDLSTLSDQKLHGVVPDVFDQLSDLQQLDLSDHCLHGLLPQTIFGHPSLLTVVLRRNLFSGPLQAGHWLPSHLTTLDVEFNMLSGGLGPEFCSVAQLRLRGNSHLCGSLPHCLRYMALTGAAGTGLDGGGGLARACNMPVASCDAATGSFPYVGDDELANLEGHSCRATIDKAVIGRVPITVTFSSLTDVDILMVEFTDFGLHGYRAWFWAQDQRIRALMDPQVHVVVGTRLTVPHQVSRPGAQTSRTIPPSTLSLNVADLPGDLLQASQLTTIVTAFRILPESIDPAMERYALPLGPYNTSVLQMTVPAITVHRKAPKITYASVDESLASRLEVKVTWQVQHEYRVTAATAILLYHANGDWNAMVQSISNQSTTYVFAVSPRLNESTNTYTFRWEALLDAVRAPVPDSQVLGSSGGFASSQASFADGHLSHSPWWQAQETLPTDDGGLLVSPSFLRGHGMEDVFPSGTYMISIQVVDEHGISGSTAIGPVVLEDAIESHGTILLAAYVFSAGIITSALVYWCIQRFLYGYVGKLLKLEPMLLALRDVEDFFDELKQGMRLETAGVVDFSQDSEMCLVVSDMENSTLLSVESPVAFAASQEIHDALMMELIQQCAGVELMREGDSFRVAFKNSEQAIAFCLKVQLRLLEMPWAQNILSMKGCHEVRDEEGCLLFAGLRVRLGVYWAAQGSVVALFNEGTCTYNIQGPGMDTAVAISDSAHGGQSVMTAEVWTRAQSRLPLAGFPIIERLGTFQYPDDRYNGDLYQLCGRIYRPLERAFPPLRGCLLEDGSSCSNSRTAPSFNRDLMSSTSQVNTMGDPYSPTPGAAGPTLVCCSLAPLTSQDGLYMDPDNSHSLAQLCVYLDKRVADYAQQWGGTRISFSGAWINIKQSSPWVWILAFDQLASALRFVFSMQYGMLAEVWKRSYMQYFPPAERGPNGRILHHGPRLTFAVHTTTVSSGADSASKTHHSLYASSGSKKPTDTSSGTLSFEHDHNGCSSMKDTAELAAACAPPDFWSQQRRARQPHRSFVSRQSVSSSMRCHTASNTHHKDAGRKMTINACDDRSPMTEHQSSSQQQAHVREQPLSPSSDCCWQHTDAPQTQYASSITTQNKPFMTQSMCQVQGCDQLDTTQSTNMKVQSTSEDERLWHHGFRQHRSSGSNTLSATSPQANSKSCQTEEAQYPTSQERSESMLEESGKPAATTNHGVDQKYVKFLTTLTTCGLLHPGQMVLTDSAFPFYQEMQVGTCEVYDHGVFCFEDFGFKFGLKELLPARLHGRRIMAPNTSTSGAHKVQRGYHDAPSIDNTMCICFCKLHMPQAVRKAERLLLNLWARQQQSISLDTASHTQTRAVSGAVDADAAVADSSQGMDPLPQQALSGFCEPSQQQSIGVPKAQGHEPGVQAVTPNSTQSESSAPAHRHLPFPQSGSVSSHEQCGRAQTDHADPGAMHENGSNGSVAEIAHGCRANGHTDSARASSTSNATLSQLVNVMNGASAAGNATVRSQADTFKYPHPAELLPAPQSVWSRKLMCDGPASLQAHEWHMAGRLKELKKIKDTVSATVKHTPRSVLCDRQEGEDKSSVDSPTLGVYPLPSGRWNNSSSATAPETIQPCMPKRQAGATGTQSLSANELIQVTSPWPKDTAHGSPKQEQQRLHCSHALIKDAAKRSEENMLALAAEIVDVDLEHEMSSQLAHTSGNSSAVGKRASKVSTHTAQSNESTAPQEQARADHPEEHGRNTKTPDVPTHHWQRSCSMPVLQSAASRHKNSTLTTCTHPYRYLHLQKSAEMRANASPPLSDERQLDAALNPPGFDAPKPNTEDTLFCKLDCSARRTDTSTTISHSQLPSALKSKQSGLWVNNRGEVRGFMHCDPAKHYRTGNTCPADIMSRDNEASPVKNAMESALVNSVPVEAQHTPEPQMALEQIDDTASTPHKHSGKEGSKFGASTDELYDVISAFCLIVSWSVTVAMYSRVFLELLEQHNGYLCKETDPGKFTVAFHSWNAGIVWALCLKQRLAMQHYPEDIIELPELAARYDANGALVCRGVQPQIGCCHGKLQRKRPTAIGRADYYGVTANTAARIMSKARPGQILIGGVPAPSGSCELGGEVHLLGFESGDVSTFPQQAGIVRLHPLGRHLLKGIRKPVPIFEAKATWLQIADT